MPQPSQLHPCFPPGMTQPGPHRMGGLGSIMTCEGSPGRGWDRGCKGEGQESVLFQAWTHQFFLFSSFTLSIPTNFITKRRSVEAPGIQL